MPPDSAPLATPGTITLTAAVHQRVGLFFECRPLGLQRLRGAAQPIELHEVLREAASRNRVELVDPGNLTPLIGRDTELGCCGTAGSSARRSWANRSADR
ncbi:MAG UNVERIFIED_CONTAM: hypothetical protein LVR18_34125 [Planctomycetaceae bacterium]